MQPHPPPLEVKGQDPQSLDLSDTPAIAKCFGVHPLIVSESHLAAQDDREDLAIGSYGLSSGRDQNISGASPPRDPNSWFSIFVPTSVPGVQSPVVSKLTIWLPKDREMVNKVVDVYFTHLNIHRPVFFRSDFERRLNALYDMENVNYDPGFVCSMYIILALGTLSELNRKATLVDRGLKSPTDSPISTKNLLSSEWPEHYEFFERALAVKPQLHVTITSLQALILLQWYLYTERQGRSLWRLVGTLVRLSIELGLHHDPTSRNNTFTEEEAQLRIRLWGIVILHDRGTSILLGRPLAIAPCDSNTPHPSRHLIGQPLDFSEHFLLSHPVAEIQADIINSLHAPSNKAADAVLRHATRIIKSLTEFRRQLPESYTYYFGGTEDWPLDKRQELVRGITEDQGLTLLKIGITKILLLRVLFRLKELDYMHRSKALDDAIVASHNIIIVHNQLIRYPHAVFFISPIPLHIAAMVILYGHMSHCERLSRQVMIEDVWMALDMLPRFRWRWERKDLNDGHPLISTLAEKVLNVDLRSVSPPKDPVLLPESDWETETVIVGSPSMSSPRQAHFAEIPTGLFYPCYLESQMGPITNSQASGANDDRNGSNENSQPLAAAVAQPDGSNGTYGHQPSQDSYMLKEIVPPSILANGNTGAIWMNVVSAPHIDRD